MGCWTSQQSKQPWHNIAQAIKMLDENTPIRVSFVEGVQALLQQYKDDTKKLYCNLGQHVLKFSGLLPVPPATSL
jgi:hypothetical protein